MTLMLFHSAKGGLPRDSNPAITSNPEDPIIGTQSVTLGVNGLNGDAGLYTFAWNCSKWCRFLGEIVTQCFMRAVM